MNYVWNAVAHAIQTQLKSALNFSRFEKCFVTFCLFLDTRWNLFCHTKFCLLPLRSFISHVFCVCLKFLLFFITFFWDIWSEWKFTIEGSYWLSGRNELMRNSIRSNAKIWKFYFYTLPIIDPVGTRFSRQLNPINWWHYAFHATITLNSL